MRIWNEQDIIWLIRATQIVKDLGWVLIDEGRNSVTKAINDYTSEEIEFINEFEMFEWISFVAEKSGTRNG